MTYSRQSGLDDVELSDLLHPDHPLSGEQGTDQDGQHESFDSQTSDQTQDSLHTRSQTGSMSSLLSDNARSNKVNLHADVRELSQTNLSNLNLAELDGIYTKLFQCIFLGIEVCYLNFEVLKAPEQDVTAQDLLNRVCCLLYTSPSPRD